MDITTAILITVAILFCTNLIGYIYTALILHTNLINDYRIQPKEYFAKRFYERFPLILFNISILLILFILSLIFTLIRQVCYLLDYLLLALDRN